MMKHLLEKNLILLNFRRSFILKLRERGDAKSYLNSKEIL